ncbi:hypothetical protein CPC08DRAFT_176591 [Agrocybe pediades]|nr:hypothetical protein CPC08DRAFT_176591 [Agrocybe pediades]
MFIESINQDPTLGGQIILSLTSFIVFVFADGLLVWRCFHSCGGSFRRALLPIALFTVEIVLAVTTMVYNCLFNAKPDFKTDQTAVIFDRLSATAFVAVAATSLVSTGLICLQIWQHTTLSSRSTKHYRTIISALIESSVTYTVAVLLQAILNFIERGNAESTFKVFLISNFVSMATLILPGLVPTLMIAHLFVSPGQEDYEVSSARLPSELISHASNANGINMAGMGADLEIQQIRFMGERKQGSNEIQAVPRNEFNNMRGQRQDKLDDRLKIIV